MINYQENDSTLPYRPNIKYLISVLIQYFEEKKKRFLGEGRLIEGATYWETINL